MTRLFNLESYAEVCSLAQLYNQPIEASISGYKAFIDRYQGYGYLADAIHPSSLSLNYNSIPHQSIGVDLTGDQQKLYIIPDRLNLLRLRTLFKPGENYLYKSAYYYWNYHSQIRPYLNRYKKVIFLDLNKVSDELVCQIEFDYNLEYPYPIPILNHPQQGKGNLALHLNTQDVYHKLCQAIADELIKANFPQLVLDIPARQHLARYLEKIKFFSLIPSHPTQTDFTFLVEILAQGKIHYKNVTLNIATLELIMSQEIDFGYLKYLSDTHGQCLFILISDYNYFSRFRQSIASNNLVVINPELPEFDKILVEKKQDIFPLFGQYLDKIAFKISVNNQVKWIDLLSPEEQNNIYYEGEEDTKIFVGSIRETGQDTFTLPYPQATLPIQINGVDYLLKDVPQDYLIKNPVIVTEKEQELKIKLEFALKPGYTPELKVRDVDNKYQIESELGDRLVIKYKYIPLANLIKNRNSAPLPSKDQQDEIINELSQLNTLAYYVNKQVNRFSQIVTMRDYIDRAYNKINRSVNNPDLFLNLDVEHTSLKQIKAAISQSNLAYLIELILDYLENNFNFPLKPEDRDTLKQITQRFLIFLGKTYKFSPNLPLKEFFARDLMEIGYKEFKVEYLFFLSRVACQENLQQQYFNYFEDRLERLHVCYQLDKYLWGYSRILAWYVDFPKLAKSLNYTNHFQLISTYMANNNCSNEYSQNGFLALIYLLGFREVDDKFCHPGSLEYQLSQKVIKKYQNRPVKLNVVPNKSLNEYFEELLEGTCQEEALDILVKAD